VPPPESYIDDVQAYRESFDFDGLRYRFLVVELGSIFRTAGEYLTGCNQTPCTTNKPCGFTVRFALRMCCVRFFLDGLGDKIGGM
jgi:hypothetical protein